MLEVKPIQGRPQEIPKQFQIIENGNMFHRLLRNDFEHAQKSIDLQFYIFEGDETGIPLIHTLERAARRGVQVRVIVDHEGWVHHPINTWKYFHHLRKLCKEGLPIDVQFTKEEKYAFWKRDHKKNVIIDNRISYLGGRNISQRDIVQDDVMVRMDSTLVAGAQDDFDRAWENRNTNETIYINEEGNILLSETPDSHGIDESIKSLMYNAKKRIWIQTPYYDRQTLNETLATIRQQRPDVDIQVVLPNPKLNNHIIYRYITKKATKELGNMHIDVHWFEKVFSHAKLMLIDDIAVVGSSNFNNGPLTGNDDELEFISPDSTFVKDIESRFHRAFTQSSLRRSRYQNQKPLAA
jgi:cardiolipin synthase